MRNIIVNIKKAVLISLSMFVICGLGYPLLMTGIAQIIFPHQANGSLIRQDGEILGSELIGQEFTEDYFMKGRPSAINYNIYTLEEKESGAYGGVGSGSENLSATNPKLTDRVASDIENFLKDNPSIKKEDIPTDLMTASGSGLDPHISIKAAEIQLSRIAENSGVEMENLKEIVKKHTKRKALGFIGENTVNVLLVNLEIAKEMGLIN